MRYVLLALVAALLADAPPAFAQEQSPAAIALEAADPADEPPAEDGAEPDSVIPLDNRDGAIAERLKGLFSEISGLEQVRADVRAGVVTLEGVTLTDKDRGRAESIAGRLAGVASVENRIEVEHDVAKRLTPLIEQAGEIGSRILSFLPILIVALFVLLAFWIAGRLLTRSKAVSGRIAPNPLVRTLMGQIVRLAFIIVGLVLAMRIMGATTLLSSVLGAAGVIGLAVGFAIRDTIENYIASILLSIRRPFAPNDLVIIEGVEGRVTRLNSRATFLTTLAGNEVRIPNAIVYKSKIENYTTIPERRFEFQVGIGYENDLSCAIATAHKAALETPGVLARPDPAVLVDVLGDSTIVLEIRAWMNQNESDFYKVRSAAMRSIKEAFDKQKISMPEPIQNVRLLRGDQMPPNEEDLVEAPPPAKEEVDAATDTSPDRTIEGKVAKIRAGPEEDLLSTAAPRE